MNISASYTKVEWLEQGDNTQVVLADGTPGRRWRRHQDGRGPAAAVAALMGAGTLNENSPSRTFNEIDAKTDIRKYTTEVVLLARNQLLKLAGCT